MENETKNEFVELHDREVRDAVFGYFAKMIFEPLKASEMGAPIWIAGGAVRDFIRFRSIEAKTDVDVWTSSDHGARVAETAAKREAWKLLFESPDASTWRTDGGKLVQIIRGHHFAGPIATIRSFDFTVCAFAVDHLGRVFHHRDAFIDLAMMRLKLIGVPFPSSTLARVLKYGKKGFSMCGGELEKLRDAIGREMLDDLAREAEEQRDGTNRPAVGRRSYPWRGLD